MLAVVILLFTQAAALQHHHSGDLKPPSNCDLCLSAGSPGSVIPTYAAVFDSGFASPPPEYFLSPLLGKSTATPMARAPPQLLSSFIA